MVVVGATFRGFAALTRGYRVVRPLRGRQHRRMPIQMWYEDGDTTTACSGDGDGDDSIADALHRHRHEDRGTTATCCGTTSLPRFCSGMATGTTAPRGPNYSITAGEHGEPAEGEPHIYMYGPKGVERAYALHSQPRQQAGGEQPPEGMTAQDTHTRRAFDPLGADGGGGGHLPRVRCAHPRL